MWLKFELANYEVKVQHISHYAKERRDRKKESKLKGKNKWVESNERMLKERDKQTEMNERKNEKSEEIRKKWK